MILLLITNNNKNENKNENRENFVQVQIPMNKESVIIKPLQVTQGYNQSIKTYERDDPVINPIYRNNVIPKLLNSSKDLNLPGQSNGLFEQEKNKQKNMKKEIDKIKDKVKYKNSKKIRVNSGHIVRPIELDYSPSTNSKIEKAYLTNYDPQSHSKYLEYEDILNKYNYAESKLEQVLNNGNIIKNIIKKSAKLSLESTENIGSVNSIEKANYAIGYFDTLRNIMTDFEIKKNVDIDLDKFIEVLKQNQKINLNKIMTNCKNISIDKKYLLEILEKL